MIIKTPSRLHFGIIDLSRAYKREYGALGVSLKGGYKIEIESIDEKDIKVVGDEREKSIVRDVYSTLAENYDLSCGFEVNILESVPSHVGLGSTTQITLGAGYGMLKAAGKEIKVSNLASMLDRARYSAIGTYGFRSGGFILEGGKTKEQKLSPLLFRSDVPEDWRFLIICPKRNKGYDEKEERPIMDELKVEKKYPEKISHNILMGILPALVDEDIRAFGKHITRIQELVGRSFSSYQEGTYNPAVSDIVESLKEETYGAGQSSWGPTAYGLVKKDELNNVKKKVLPNDGKDHRVWIGEPNNEGVKID